MRIVFLTRSFLQWVANLMWALWVLSTQTLTFIHSLASSLMSIYRAPTLTSTLWETVWHEPCQKQKWQLNLAVAPNSLITLMCRLARSLGMRCSGRRSIALRPCCPGQPTQSQSSRTSANIHMSWQRSMTRGPSSTRDLIGLIVRVSRVCSKFWPRRALTRYWEQQL
jgi:hypothetical protein